MTPEQKSHRDETWVEKTSRQIAEWRRDFIFTDDPPLSAENPFRKGGPNYRPYPKDAQGNILHFDPVAQNTVDDDLVRRFEERYQD